MDYFIPIEEKLKFVYGEPNATKCADGLRELIQEYKQKIERRRQEGGYGKNFQTTLTQKDAVLITYGDQIKGDKQHSALENLKLFADQYLKEYVTAIHLLPFFPYSSDDGFSVIDYCKVNQDWGEWSDVDNLTENFRLMFDYVANHMSAQSDWFEKFLQGEKNFDDFFVVVEGNPDLSQVVRPRAHPLLTSFDKKGQQVKVWTTFSEDQVDINYANPDVFLVMSKILLEYYLHGASMIRLDAILYMWKQIGTDCVHLPQTHALIQVWRDMTELVMPEAVILAEVSAPHVKNMTYLGNGKNECNMIYQFPLAPLTLYSFLKQDASIMTEWADKISVPDKAATFFNLLACHDGIGVMPARGILPEEEILWLADEMKKRGGDVSYKTNSDGTKSPYELNIVYRDAIRDLNADENTNTQRFLCAYAIILAMRGVPGLYVQALLGSYNSPEEVEKTGMKRSINRKKFDMEALVAEMQDTKSYRYPVLQGFADMMQARRNITAFDPYGEMKILDLGKECFAIARKNEADGGIALALYNVTQKPVSVRISSEKLKAAWGKMPIHLNSVFAKANAEIKDDILTWQLPGYGYEWIIEKEQ